MMMKYSSYHFDFGNSNTGCIGMCAQVKATTRKEAASLLNKTLSESATPSRFEPDGTIVLYEGEASHGASVEYIHVYLSANAKVADIDSFERS